MMHFEAKIERMINLKIDKTINIAIGCVMGSYIENGEKHLVIDKLRDLETEISRMKSALENIQEIIDGNNVTPLLEDIYRTVNRGLGIGN